MFNKLSLFILCLLFLSSCENKAIEKSSVVQPACMAFQKSCEVFMDNKKVNIFFNAKKIKPEQPFGIFIVADEQSNDFVYSGYLEGVNMFMGKIPLFFEIKEDKTIQANTMFGSCSEKNIVWRVWIIAQNKLTKVSHKQYIDIHVFIE